MSSADRARARMVRALRRDGRVRTPAVAAALQSVPRHLFLPGEPVNRAYADEAVAVQHVEGAATSSASQPSMMAIMLEQLAALPGHRVLEIGAGTGYNAALLAHLVGPAGAVTSVDIDPDLVASAAEHLRAAGVEGVELVLGDGARGHPPGAPYDRIVLTVGSGDVRPEWVAQLAPGGRLLLPLSVRGSQLSVAFDLGADGALRSDSVRSCAFIRLRGVGAGDPVAVPLPGTDLLLQLPDPGPDAPAAPDPDTLAAMLAGGGPARAAPVPLRSADVWDGFGLWLSLAEPTTCRLFGGTGPGSASVAAGLFPLGTGRAGLALTGPDGVALVGPGEPAEAPARIHAYGAGGPQLADRVHAAAQDWLAAGRPTAPDLHLTVSPTGAPVDTGGLTLVNKPLSRLLVGWSVDPAAG